MYQAKQAARSGDRGAAFTKCDEALAIDVAYAGDVWYAKATCLGDSSDANAAEKKEYWNKAIAAYQKPGAKTTYPRPTAFLIQQLEQLKRGIDRLIKAQQARR